MISGGGAGRANANDQVDVGLRMYSMGCVSGVDG